jgi:uncharacterized protein (TIGR02145 family)
MKYIVTFLLAALSLNAVGQTNPNYNPDYDANGVIGVDDLLGILSTFGDTWDSGDVIVGCTYPAADEYNPSANVDDGSCTFLPVFDCGLPVPYEGYYYSTVLIGDQCWFSENCRYLPEVSPSSQGSETDPYYYVYDYQGSDVTAAQATANYATYGVLYNWPAVITEGICPSGWHIPSDGEFTELTDFLGGVSVAGGKMKSTYGWNNVGNGTNSNGWTGFPGGYRYSGGFDVDGNNGYWWSASESGSHSWLRVLYHDYDDVSRVNFYSRDYGFSARCVRD